MARKKTAKSKRPEQGISEAPLNEPQSPVPSTLSIIAKKQPRQPPRGTGPEAAGQSGALQGLPRRAEGNSESVEELVEEGQSHEADVVSGVESAREPDQGEVQIHEVPAHGSRRNQSEEQ